MPRSILLLDNNSLNRLGPYQRDQLRSNLRVTGREYWPTAVNVLEALQTSDSKKRETFLRTINDLAGDHHALTLPGEALKRIAIAHSSGTEIDWSEPGVTRLFRYPESITEDELALVRKHIAEEEANFNAVHDTARSKLKPHIKEAGGMTRWSTPADFIEEFWTSAEHLRPYIEHLWRSWGLPGDAPVEELLNYQSFRLFFDGWGAATYARTVEHPQRGIVQASDLTQLVYLGAAADRILVTDDREFRDLGNAILRGRYSLAELVPFDAVAS